jgi:hypothetical protein
MEDLEEQIIWNRAAKEWTRFTNDWALGFGAETVMAISTPGKDWIQSDQKMADQDEKEERKFKAFSRGEVEENSNEVKETSGGELGQKSVKGRTGLLCKEWA